MDERMNKFIKMSGAYKPGIDIIGFYLKELTGVDFVSLEMIQAHILSKKDKYEQIIECLTDLRLLSQDARKIIVEKDYPDRGDKGLMDRMGDTLVDIDEILDVISSPVEENNNVPVSDEAAKAEAMKILKTGKPIDYILRVFHKDYVGEHEYGKLLYFSSMCGSCLNTLGTHPGVDGESGSGKTLAMQVMGNLNAPEYYINGGVSAKGLYYNEVKPGTTILLDDVGKMSEDMAQIVKVSITNYQTEQTLLTVSMERKGIKLKSKKRVNWWLTGVDVNSLDRQITNRLVNMSIDKINPKDKAEHKKQILQHQIDDCASGRPPMEVTFDVQVCREMSRILLDDEPVNVIMPWTKDEQGNIITWKDEENSRNFIIFKDLVSTSASIHRYQRNRDKEGNLIATLEDFDNAKSIIDSVSKEQTSKLTKKDQELYNAIIRLNAENVPIDVYQIAGEVKKAYTTVYQRLFGDKSKGVIGLVEKCGGAIQVYKQNETEYAKEIGCAEYPGAKTIGSVGRQRTLIQIRKDLEVKLIEDIVKIDRARAEKKLQATYNNL